MMDFRMEMQERIDAGMSDVEAYNAARDSIAGYSDFRDVFDLPMNVGPCCGPNGCSDELEVCNCTCDADCECKAREDV